MTVMVGRRESLRAAKLTNNSQCPSTWASAQLTVDTVQVDNLRKHILKLWKRKMAKHWPGRLRKMKRGVF